MKKHLILFLAVALLIGLAACVSQPVTAPSTEPTLAGRVELTLEGEKEITLEFGEHFQDPGAKGIYYAPATVLIATNAQVQVEGKVDETKLGTYTLTYTVSYEDMQKTLQRIVHIVDTTAPVITLVTDPAYYTQPGEAYQEEGFTAVDNYDGDVTDQVQRREEDGRIIYTVSDSSGNKTEVTREIVYGDQTAPVLQLMGDRHITITAGSAFPEPGYSATDNCDGDLTGQVTVTGLDRYIAGTYTVVYSVTDSFGNTTTDYRTVTVNPIGAQPDVVQPTDKTIYLTFDDGPGPYTQQLLDILAKYNVKATFFVVGGPGGAYMPLLKNMADAGHAIGMHSVTHNYGQIYASPEAFFADLKGMQQTIYDYTGIWSTLMRFPGGSSNQVSDTSMIYLTQAVQDQGFQYFDWNVSSGDAGGTTDPEQVFLNVINGVSGKHASVVLQHDIKDFSVAAVEKIIVWGLANGYTFLPLTPDSPGAHHRPAY